MIHLLSRYRPRYARSLTYMLQSTEYNLGDYLAWYRRTNDFSRVETRKQLVKTPKAMLVLAVVWATLLILAALSIALIWWVPPPLGYALAILGLIITPTMTAYAITLPLLFVRYVIQRPIEVIVTRRAARRLQQHSGYKIAVAGSFGKTSLREILRTVLAEGTEVAAPPHSFNTPLGISKFAQKLTGREKVLVFELGEYYPGDIRRLCQLVRPQLGVITGVNEAHLSKFKTLKRTVGTIFELADWLGNQPVYVNGENELAAAAARPGHIIYTRNGAGIWKVEHAKTGLEGTSFTLINGRTKLPVTTQLLGLHHIGPLAAAADIALRLGLTPEQIARGIAAVKPFDHRLEPTQTATGVTMLDDSYNGNPDGTAAVINFLATLKHHRRFYVTPGLVEMGPRTKHVHEEIGRQLAEAGIEQVILVRNSATPHIACGLEAANFAGQLTWFPNGPAALAALPHLTVSGDVVLLQNDWPDQYA